MNRETDDRSNFLTGFLVKNRWAWHLGFWLGYVAYRAWSYYATLLDYREFLTFMLIRDLVFFVIFTYVIIWLYKLLIYKKKYGLYFICGTFLTLLHLFFVLKLQQATVPSIGSIKNPPFVQWFFTNLSLSLLTFLVLSFAKYFKDSFISQFYENEQRQLKMKSELDNLKAQISPHFLFNTMNNFYGLAVEKSNKLPNLMIKLSELLRYSLYETKNELVPLSKEINYLNNYIELEKIRLENTLALEFDCDVAENAEAGIAPLILMVFIENAFKHARQVMNEPIQISIHLSINKQQLLALKVKNNFFNEGNNDVGGLGLKNVKKRLEVLYPGNLHSLAINKEGKFYFVDLKLQLSSVNRG